MEEAVSEKIIELFINNIKDVDSFLENQKKVIWFKIFEPLTQLSEKDSYKPLIGYEILLRDKGTIGVEVRLNEFEYARGWVQTGKEFVELIIEGEQLNKFRELFKSMESLKKEENEKKFAEIFQRMVEDKLTFENPVENLTKIVLDKAKKLEKEEDSSKSFQGSEPQLIGIDLSDDGEGENGE